MLQSTVSENLSIKEGPGDHGSTFHRMGNKIAIRGVQREGTGWEKGYGGE